MLQEPGASQARRTWHPPRPGQQYHSQATIHPTIIHSRWHHEEFQLKLRMKTILCSLSFTKAKSAIKVSKTWINRKLKILIKFSWKCYMGPFWRDLYVVALLQYSNKRFLASNDAE